MIGSNYPPQSVSDFGAEKTTQVHNRKYPQMLLINIIRNITNMLEPGKCHFINEVILKMSQSPKYMT